MVIDTDGSAFITKAEFDSLKNNFQAQIDNYNNSIDSKIDGAIAAYLSGVKTSQSPTIYVQATDKLTFKNDLKADECRADLGIIDLSHIRINRTYGLLRSNPGSRTWYNPGRVFVIYCTGGVKDGSAYSCLKTIEDESKWQVKTSLPSPLPEHGYIQISYLTNEYADVDVSTQNANTIKTEFLRAAKELFKDNDVRTPFLDGVCNTIYWTFIATYLKKVRMS